MPPALLELLLPLLLSRVGSKAPAPVATPRPTPAASAPAPAPDRRDEQIETLKRLILLQIKARQLGNSDKPLPMQ
jgi:hypothetical protein